MQCLDHEAIKLIMAGVVLSIVAVAAFWVIHSVANKAGPRE